MQITILILFLLNQTVWILLYRYQYREVRRWKKHYYIMKQMRDSIVEGAPCDIHVHYESPINKTEVFRMED